MQTFDSIRYLSVPKYLFDYKSMDLIHVLVVSLPETQLHWVKKYTLVHITSNLTNNDSLSHFTIWYSSYCLSHKDGYSAVASACGHRQVNCLAYSGFAFRRRSASWAARIRYRRHWTNSTSRSSKRSGCPNRHRPGPAVRWIPRPGRVSGAVIACWTRRKTTSDGDRGCCSHRTSDGCCGVDGGCATIGAWIWRNATGCHRTGCSSSWSGAASPGSHPRSGLLS